MSIERTRLVYEGYCHDCGHTLTGGIIPPNNKDIHFNMTRNHSIGYDNHRCSLYQEIEHIVNGHIVSVSDTEIIANFPTII